LEDLFGCTLTQNVLFMLLKIDDHKTIGELQDKFNECFPNLKLEFYAEAHKWKNATRSAHPIDAHTRIGDVRKKHDIGMLEIKSWYKTGKVEQDLHNLFGLNAQVFRWFYDSWIETSYSDVLTLQQQSELSRK